MTKGRTLERIRILAAIVVGAVLSTACGGIVERVREQGAGGTVSAAGAASTGGAIAAAGTSSTGGAENGSGAAGGPAEPDASRCPPRACATDSAFNANTCLCEPKDCDSQHVCDGYTTPNVASGETPFGHVTLDRAGLTFTVGFTNSATITFYGELEGAGVQIIAQIEGQGDATSFSGTYPAQLYANDCNADLPMGEAYQDLATVTFADDLPSFSSAISHAPTRLTGVVRDELDPGWSLAAPFAIDIVCGRFSDH